MLKSILFYAYLTFFLNIINNLYMICMNKIDKTGRNDRDMTQPYEHGDVHVMVAFNSALSPKVCKTISCIPDRNFRDPDRG